MAQNVELIKSLEGLFSHKSKQSINDHLGSSEINLSLPYIDCHQYVYLAGVRQGLFLSILLFVFMIHT